MIESANSTFCADRSFRNRAWEFPRLPHVADAPAAIPTMAAQIAKLRGVKDLTAFFKSSFVASMPDPNVLTDMKVAADRFCLAIRQGESIGVIGDYDVDGATSTALVIRFLKSLGHSAVAWRIPDRITDGYGPNVRIVDELRDSDDITLLLLLDSGTMAFTPIRHAREKGIDVVVLDHHEPDPSGLPDAILVNPKRSPEDRKLEYLCSAGLVFLFLVAVLRNLRESNFFAEGAAIPDLRNLLGLVALGTVADVVPLVELNRAYVTLGLPRLADIVGVRGLVKVTKQSEFSPQTCGFVFGPCLNAAGRIDDMALSVALLTCEDETKANELSERLFELNQERRGLQIKAVEEAKAMIEAGGSNRSGVIVLYSKDWHPGVVGLIAARVREYYDRPAIVIGAEGKGSCRSVDGYNIGKVIISACKAGLLLKGGGHGAAAGLTMDPSRISELRAFVDADFADFVAPPALLDLVIPCGMVTPSLVSSLEVLAPFGMGNVRPRIAVVGGFGRKTLVMKGIHVKLILSGPAGEMNVVAFGAMGTPFGDALLASEGRFIDVMGVLEVKDYNGAPQVTLKPQDFMLGAEIDSAAA